MLREGGWGTLPPPPVFATEKPGPTGVSPKDLAATPVATSLGLPNRALELHTPPPLQLESVMPDAIPVSPATRSPSISIATLSDFTIADTSDDEPPIDPTGVDTSDEELPLHPAAMARDEIFYLEDGNVEVLCGNTLFRVHVSTLSFQSPALRRMFVQTGLAAAESPNGCPRIMSSDTAKDFSTLLKVIYLPGFASPFRGLWIIPLTIWLLTDFLRGTKCRSSLHSRPSSESQQSMRYPPFGLSCSRSSAVRTQRNLKDWDLPSRSEREYSVDMLPTPTRSSTFSSSKTSRPRCRWHTTWRLERARSR